MELHTGPRSAVLGEGTACECSHGGLRWSSRSSRETRPWEGEPHASAAIGALGGAPYGATKRCPGWGGPHPSTATRAFGGIPD
eukprot:4275940-Pyramimonas_sp.AAC.1